MTTYTPSDKYLGMRAALSHIVKNCDDPLDIISALSGLLYQHAVEYAQRTGNYSQATQYIAISQALDNLEEKFDQG